MPKRTTAEKKEVRQLENQYLDRLTSHHVNAAINEFDRTDRKAFYKLVKSAPSVSDFIKHRGVSYPMKAILKRAMQISEGRDDLEFAHQTRTHRPYVTKLGFRHHQNAPKEGVTQEHKKEKWAKVRSRPFQESFRRAVLERYNNMCCFSGVSIGKAVEAAHLEAWVEADNNETGNGLPIRADLHRLFDVGLISIEPKTHIIYLHSSLMNDYARLHKVPLQYQIELSKVGTVAISNRWELKL